MTSDLPIIRLYCRVLRGLTDEAITSTMCSFNEARRCRVIMKSLANLTNGNFKDCVTDKSPWPDGVEKFLFCDELAGTANQMVEHGKGLGSELYCLRALPKTRVGQIQAKGVKDDSRFIPHISHRRLSKL